MQFNLPNKKRKLRDKIRIFLSSLFVQSFFKIESKLLNYYSVNYPEESPHIIAVWHSHQCVLYDHKDRARLNVLVSRSTDGQIISNGLHSLGIKTIRGSKGKRGAATSTLKMLDKLKSGEYVAITVDGPRGPKHVVKEGVIAVSKLSQVPIIPLVWHSNDPTFVKFNTWDEFTLPITFCNVVALYGDPIYVPADIDKDGTEEYRLLLENKLIELHKDLTTNFQQYLKEVKAAKK